MVEFTSFEWDEYLETLILFGHRIPARLAAKPGLLMLSDFHSNKLTIRLYSKKRKGHVISSQFWVHQFTDGLAVVVPDFQKSDVVYRFLCFDLMIFFVHYDGSKAM